MGNCSGSCEGGCQKKAARPAEETCHEEGSPLVKPTTFRDTLYTIDSSGKRKWVYCEVPKGRYMFARRIVAYLLVVFYLGTPWITVGGKQALLIDIVGRKLTVFGFELWATDTIFLMFLFGMAAIALFFFTSLFGRVWCGWACPETVFLEHIFRPIERLIEGSPAKRRKLDEAPWTLSKVQKKALKAVLSAGAAWIIATTFLAYFYGAKNMAVMVTDVPWHHPYQFALTVLFMGLFAFQFGWFREQFCTVLCPYARFQSVLLDADSLAVSYDRARGEPRAKKRERDESSGDCIDCGACVRVCPTGIDIRNGLQLECIHCTSCMDACDEIMDSVGKPRGLVRYSTERELGGGKKRFLRPRVFVYATILTVYLGLFGYQTLNRKPFDFEVLRFVGAVPYTNLADGRVANPLRVRVSNKSQSRDSFTILLKDPPQGVTLTAPMNPITLNSGEIVTAPVFIEFQRELLRDKPTVHVGVQGESGESYQKVKLLGPDLE